ncbi:hypothetical protein M8J76_000281 [Diaphorina citri]|nr:hypothetical protein M8J75_005419 [Diaphorina citri]KAI5748571.1 hypothetical protein M8J76_000281 [Diaphorina citri]
MRVNFPQRFPPISKEVSILDESIKVLSKEEQRILSHLQRRTEDSLPSPKKNRGFSPISKEEQRILSHLQRRTEDSLPSPKKNRGFSPISKEEQRILSHLQRRTEDSLPSPKKNRGFSPISKEDQRFLSPQRKVLLKQDGEGAINKTVFVPGSRI